MVISTIKFSEFVDGGDLSNNKTTVGLDGGSNTRFNNPWTFLAPGPTGDRPPPSAGMYFRQRFNTTLEVYEYYDPTIPIWVELSGSGTGTVNPGVTNDIAYYAASGQAVSPIAANANSVLVTNSSSVPSLSTTLPSGLSIPGAAITASTAALLSGSVVAAPVAGIDLTNKIYVDGLFSTGVISATGTTNQVLVNGVAGVPISGAITLALPQDIATGSTPTFLAVKMGSVYDSNGMNVLSFGTAASAVNYLSIGNSATGGGPTIAPVGSDTNIPIAYVTKGTGQHVFTSDNTTTPLVINSGTSHQHTTNFIFSNTSATRNVTFQDASGTLAYTSDLTGFVTSVSGTTNRITSTGGTTPVIDISASYVGQSSITTVGALSSGSLAAGFTPVTVPIGGTGNTTFTAYSVICAGTTATGAFQNVSGVGTANQVLVSNGAGALPTWQSVPGLTPAALTKVDDTNVTLSLGGSPTVALLAATSLTLGWTGQLSLTRGGTNASLTASNGGIVYSTASALAILAGTATAGQMLQSGSSAAPSWSTATFPSTAGSAGTILRANGTNWVASTATFADTYSASTLLYSNGANTVTGLATANSAVLVTNSSGVPAWSGTMTNGQLIIGNTSGTPTAATLTAGSGVSISNGAGTITISASTSGLTWTTVSGTTQSAAVNSGYITNNAGAVTVTLPTTFAVGDTVTVKGLGAGGWVLAAGTATTIRMGSSVTSSAGSLTSANQYDTVKVTGLVANTTWSVDYALSTGLTVA